MYSKELIEEVKELYPDSPEMIKHAETGNVWLGRYLDDSASNCIHVDKILTALSLEELQKIARIEKRKSNLYTKWIKEDPRKR